MCGIVWGTKGPRSKKKGIRKKKEGVPLPWGKGALARGKLEKATHVSREDAGGNRAGGRSLMQKTMRLWAASEKKKKKA